MPNISVVVNETKQSILRPVVLDVVRQLMEITKIPAETSILYPDDIGKAHQPGSALSEDSAERTLFPNNDKVVIEVDEEINSASVLSTAVSKPEHLPIFDDESIGVFVKPVYSTTDITITFKYKSSGKSAANRWRDDIKMRTSAGRDVNLHKVTYHYIVPGDIINIIKEIHRLREKVDGYGDSFDKYLLDNSSARLTEVTNQAGSNVMPAVAESQIRIVGVFGFEAAPEKLENDDEHDGWIGTFTYKFSFDKPVACNMRYPCMIHNQVLSTKFRPSEGSYDLDDHLQSFSLSAHSFNYFESQLQAGKYVDFKASLTLPGFDEFIPNSIPVGTVSIFSTLCQISSDDKKSLINLKDLGTVALDSDILDFMINSEYPFMTKAYRSIFNLSLYRGMRLAAENTITFDNKLDVKSVHDLSLRTSHRVRLSIVSDLSLLDKAALARLKLYPKALVKIIRAVNEAFRNNPGFKDLGTNGRITQSDLNDIINGYSGAGNRIKFNTVQLTSVIAIRTDLPFKVSV